MELLEGAGILLSGIAVGRFWPARRKEPKPTKAVCGCRHELSFHDADTRQCHGTNRKSVYDSYGEWVGYQDVACTCRQYTGPEPLPSYYAPEISS